MKVCSENEVADAVGGVIHFMRTLRNLLPLKALPLMLFTLLPMITEARPVQFLKTLESMLVKPLPIVTVARAVQPVYSQLIVYQDILIKTVEK